MTTIIISDDQTCDEAHNDIAKMRACFWSMYDATLPEKKRDVMLKLIDEYTRLVQAVAVYECRMAEKKDGRES